MMLNFSAMYHAGKLKFSSYVHLQSISVGEVIIFERGCYISALEHARMYVNNKQLCSSSVCKRNL